MAFLWYIITPVLIFPVVLAFYLLSTPRDTLIEKWQRFRLRYTGKPLKDEDFLYLPKWIPLLRTGAFLILVFTGWTLYVILDRFMN